MNEEEKKAYEFYKKCNDNDLSNFEYFSEPSKKQITYMKSILNLIEKQQNRIDELEKALIDEDFKHKEKIKQIKDRLEKDIKNFEYTQFAIRNTFDFRNSGIHFEAKRILDVLEGIEYDKR